jgi:hypothetical protein
MSLRQVVFVVAACTVPDKHELEIHATGDAGTTASHDAASTPDTTAPVLATVSPAPGSAWRHGPILLTFDEPLDAGSIAATTAVATFSGDPIRASVTFQAPEAVVITLDKLPKHEGTLVLVVSATIADLAGNTIAQPLAFATEIQ